MHGWSHAGAACLGVRVVLKLALLGTFSAPPDPPPANIVKLLTLASFDNGASLMSHTMPQFAAAWWLAGNAHLNVTKLTKLKALELQWSQLAGHMLPSLGELTGLTSLTLSNNNLASLAPSSLGALPGLTTLDLDDKCLTGAPGKTSFHSADLSSDVVISRSLHRPNSFDFCHACRPAGLTSSAPTLFGQLSALAGLFVEESNFAGLISTAPWGQRSMLEQPLLCLE